MAKKLIEVALPLEKINAESAREKSIRHGHPSTLHLWWARRPLAAARAVIWASLVDDPSEHPELFPLEEDQTIERQRLFKILEELVVWENSNNKRVLDAAKKEIIKSTSGKIPILLDPFAGGGAIPLEAQRLGLKAIAHDLNPVAVMINKGLIEIPSIYKGIKPVNPESSQMLDSGEWEGTSGLVSDFKYYSKIFKKKAENLLAKDYPKIRLPLNQGGNLANVIAWIWAKTVKCPNPACANITPLASSFVLSSRKGNETWVDPINENGKIRFKVIRGKCPSDKKTIKMGKGASFKCICCGTVIDKKYIHEEFIKERIGSSLMAIVAEGKRGRIYLDPTEEQELVAKQIEAPDVDLGLMPIDSPNLVSGRGYGITKWEELFTKRQLNMLDTLSKIVKDLAIIIRDDANKSTCFKEKGIDPQDYGNHLSVYFSFLVDKLSDYHSSVCSWHSSKELIRNTFGRQAIPMVWDFAEANPLSNSAGCIDSMIEWITKCLQLLPASAPALAEQSDAQTAFKIDNIMVSTDPPYYDNIEYSVLSDFFYIWMRKSLKSVYPQLFGTMMVPKQEELIAVSHRFNGNMEDAKNYFESGMLQTCKNIYDSCRNDIPVTIYYAYKQSTTENDQKSSTGWETMLSSIVKAGFSITGTWPMRTEMANRSIASGSNALASSIVLVCRKRAADAQSITRRNLVNILHRELRPALKKLQESNIAPVDLAQSAIGPGMGVYSRYKLVLEADGTPMSVRSALQLINEEIDLYFNEQVGDMDAASRFCIDLYTQNAYNDIKYGEAEVLANAKGTSIPMMALRGVLYAKAGNVHLIERNELPEEVDINENNIWLLTQQLTQAMITGGVEACAKIVASMFGSNAEKAKDLAYRLYTIAEQKKWANEAYAYNALVVAWPDIQSRAASLKEIAPEQLNLFDLMDDSQ